MTQGRRIFKGVSTAQNAIRDLLTNLFCQELLVPSRELIVVAPWITDTSILDNSSGDFSAINPEWSQREIRLLEVLTQLAAVGTLIRIAVRPEEHNQSFIRKAVEASEENGISDRFRIREIENLHTKGMLSDRWVLLGSMNLTRNGIEINEEYVTYELERGRIAEARIHFNNLLGSA